MCELCVLASFFSSVIKAARAQTEVGALGTRQHLRSEFKGRLKPVRGVRGISGPCSLCSPPEHSVISASCDLMTLTLSLTSTLMTLILTLCHVCHY